MIGFIRYRNVIDPVNGPISNVTAWPLKHPVLGEYFESVATLIPELYPPKTTDIYAHGAGGGASRSKITAIHKSISEALERWAYFDVSTHETKARENLGLELDPTSSGFACHPSFFSNEVRKKSDQEAIERWSVYNWWIGRLPARIRSQNNDAMQIEIISPFDGIKILCCAAKSNLGFYVYGFSSSDSLRKCEMQALVEQARNERCISKIPNGMQPMFRGDKRLIYFSTRDGFLHFKENVEKSFSLRSLPERPKKIVDKEVKGPWTKFARVWRTLYEGGEAWQQTANEKIFLF